MQVLQEQQSKREVMSSSDAKAARRKSAASAMLPRVFDTLRAMYGATGPAVKLYDEVSKAPSTCGAPLRASWTGAVAFFVSQDFFLSHGTGAACHG